MKKGAQEMMSGADQRPMHRFSGRSKGGFTLVELLITLVVIAILSAVAVPLYNAKVAQARQTGAQRNLVALGQLEEIYRFQNGTYTATLQDLINLGWKNDTGSAGDVGYYAFTITGANATTFTIQAAGNNGPGATADKWTINQDGSLVPL